jgi:hypothetical protein
MMTEQESKKLIRDSFSDYVQKNTNPPIKKPRGGVKYQISLQPFGEVESSPREPIEYLTPPEYPRAADAMMERLQHDVDMYNGRPTKDVPPYIAQILSQMRVDRFLGCLSEVFTLTLQLCQENMTDEMITRVTGGRGLPVPRSVDEIQGRYDVRLVLDARELQPDFVLAKAKLLLEYVRPLDTRGNLPWEEYTRSIMAAIDPNWADMIPPSDTSQQKTIQDESNCYMKILNCVEEKYPQWIDNADLRLQTLTGLHEPRLQNPAAFPALAPMAQALLENRVKYLQFQIEQRQNADIGRTGANQLLPTPG